MLVQANYETYKNSIYEQQKFFLQYPRNISIETQVKCNSCCSFCPYPSSPRQNQVMPTSLFNKILNDLKKIPKEHQFCITLHRINEPLLDGRLPEFHKAIANYFPNAFHQFWTNGTTIKKGAFEWMGQYKKANLTVSLNSIDEREHISMMGFGLGLVTKNLDQLHALKKSNLFEVPVVLCAPFKNQSQSEQFVLYCQRRWPLFLPVTRPFFKWMGGSFAGKGDCNEAELPIGSYDGDIALMPCGQWYDLHILANGCISKCCIDERGYSAEEYNIYKNDLLTIYNYGIKKRQLALSRNNFDECNGCLHLG